MCIRDSPYPYPARTDGGATSPSKTLLVTASALHQNGVPLLTSDNPVAGEFAFGETYNYAAVSYTHLDVYKRQHHPDAKYGLDERAFVMMINLNHSFLSFSNTRQSNLKTCLLYTSRCV